MAVNRIFFLLVVTLLASVDCFFTGGAVTRSSRSAVVYMGRAAAVRAATKAKTDSAKAKNNGRFAKKIIMAGL
jgi:hypothetical protein